MKLKLILALADCIRAAESAGHPFAREHIDRLADFCASHHDGFDRQKWLDYIARDEIPEDNDLSTHIRKTAAEGIRKLSEIE